MKIPSLTRTRAIIAAVALVAAGGVAAGGTAIAHRNDLPANAVFRYDGKTVTKDMLKRRVDVLSALYGVHKPTDASKLKAFNRDSAKSMAVGMVLERATKQEDITISDKQARDQLDKLIEQQLSGGQQQFTQFLASEGISERDVLDEIKQQLATSDLAKKITANVPTVTDAMARETYEKHRNTMVSPQRRHLLNTVVASKTDAQRVLRLARKGTSFPAIAATWSRDGSTKNKGGDLGTVAASDLDKNYAAAAFAVPNGSLYGPVKTRYGWNIGKVVGITKSAPVPFAKMRKSLKAALRSKEQLDAWNRYLSRQLKSANIEYVESYRPADPTALPSSEVTATQSSAPTP